MNNIQGLVVGLVTQVDVGKVKVNFPWLDEAHETDWLRIGTMMSGNNRGSFFMPEPQDEVLVAFNNPNNKPLGRGLTPPPGYTFVTSNGNYVVNNGLYVIAKVT